MDARLIGPYEDSDVGRLKIPTPMMLPMIRATALLRPKVDPAAWGTAAAPAAAE